MKKAKLRGYKQISEVLESAWNVIVSPRTAWRLAKAKTDPLPVLAIRNMVYAIEEEVRTWAGRQTKH